MKLTRSVVTVLFLTHLSAFFVIVMLTLFNKPAYLLSILDVDWIIASLLKTWVNYFVPISITALVLAFSILLAPTLIRKAVESSGTFIAMMRGSIIVIIVISAIQVLLLAFVAGNQEYRVTELENLSHSTTSNLERAQMLYEKRQGDSSLALRDLEEALGLVKAVVAVLPAYEKASILMDLIYEAQAELKKKTPTSTQNAAVLGESSAQPLASSPTMDVISARYGDLKSKAVVALEQGKAFEAIDFLYKAEQVIRFTPSLSSRLLEIQALRKQAEDVLNRPREGAKDRALAEIQNRKVQALLVLLPEGRAEEAYFELVEVDKLAKQAMDAGFLPQMDPSYEMLEEFQRELKGQQGKDAELPPELTSEDRARWYDEDVQKWMPRVKYELSKRSFTSEEADQALVNPRGSSLLVLNRMIGAEETGGSSVKEYVYAQGLGRSNFAWFLVKPEIFWVDTQGALRYHAKAEMAKILEPEAIASTTTQRRLLFRMVNLEDEGAAKDKKQEIAPPLGTDLLSLNFPLLTVEVSTLLAVASSREGYEQLSVPEILWLTQLLPNLGYTTEGLHAVLLTRLIQSFSLPSLAFLAMGWAWTNRSKYLKRPPFLLVLAIVSFPFIIAVIWNAYLQVNTLVASSFLLLTDFPLTLVLSIVVQGVLLLFALIYLASRRMD